MRLLALAALLCAVGCGKKPTPASDPLETGQWSQWRAKQFALATLGVSGTLRARITILPPDGRSKRADDFCELMVNGQLQGRHRVGKMADGRWPGISFEVTLRDGPNWLDLWDTSADRNTREEVDTRQGLDFTFRPTATGYELLQEKRE